MRRTVHGVAAAALAVVVSVGLAGCGSGGSGEGASPTSPKGGLSGKGKPSREEYRAYMLSGVEELGGPKGEDEADRAARSAAVECMSDELYDHLSAEALRAEVDRKKGYVYSDEDQEVLRVAQRTCVDSLMSEKYGESWKDPMADLRQ